MATDAHPRLPLGRPPARMPWRDLFFVVPLLSLTGLAVFLRLKAFHGCQDPSITVQHFLEEGGPSPLAPWSVAQYESAVAVLVRLGTARGELLPRLSSDNSSLLLARLTDEKTFEQVKALSGERE